MISRNFPSCRARELFEAISTIVESGYVLVRDERDRRITGIVTASDLSLQFQNLAEPFLLLREIELQIRRLLGDKLSINDFDLLGPAPGAKNKAQTVADLTFGQYLKLFQHPHVWMKLGLKIDCATMVSSPVSRCREQPCGKTWTITRRCTTNGLKTATS